MQHNHEIGELKIEQKPYKEQDYLVKHVGLSRNERRLAKKWEKKKLIEHNKTYGPFQKELIEKLPLLLNDDEFITPNSNRSMACTSKGWTNTSTFDVGEMKDVSDMPLDKLIERRQAEGIDIKLIHTPQVA